VTTAEDYRWSSASAHALGDEMPILAEWPVAKPREWLALLNLRTPAQELQRIQRSAARGAPYGSPAWVDEVVRQYGLEHTVRRRGRPTRAESSVPTAGGSFGA